MPKKKKQRHELQGPQRKKVLVLTHYTKPSGAIGMRRNFRDIEQITG